MSILAANMTGFIHLAKVCEVSNLKDLVKDTNKLLASVCHSGANLAKYYFKERTGQIEGFSGNVKTFTHPLTVPGLEY